MTRREKIGVLVFSFILVALLSLPLMGGMAVAGDTVKIAFMDPLSGPVALVGEQTHRVMKFCVDYQNKKGGILGKQIEATYVDTEFKPQVAVRKAKSLILNKEADFIVICSSSNIGIALGQVATKYKQILVNLGAISNIIQGKYFSRYAFRPFFNTWAQGAAYGAATQPYTKFYLLNPDYAFGHDFADAAAKSLVKKNPKAKIVADEYYQVGVKDWGPYLSKIKASGAEVIVSAVFGTDTLTLLKQIKEFGLKVQVASYTAAMPSVLKGAGDAAVGLIHVGGNINTHDTARMREMENLWHEMYKNHPDEDARWGYPNVMDIINGWLFFVAAVEKAGSLDSEKIIAAWEGMRFTSLNGEEVYMRECDHQMMLPMFVAKIERGKNRYIPDAPYLGKPIARIPIEDTAIPFTSDYNPRCK